MIENLFIICELLNMSNVIYKRVHISNRKGFVLSLTEIGDHDVNQDSVLIDVRDNEACLSIADGLGSAKNSAIGSKLAVEIACNEAYENPINKELINNVSQKWSKNLNSEDLGSYDTTLKCVYLGEEYVSFSSIGDGCAYIKSDNKSYFFTTENSFVNSTDTICSSRINDTSFYWFNNFSKEILIILYTDGIEQFLDSERVDEFGTLLVNEYKKGEDLKTMITEWISTWKDKNYYDDKTMAVLYLGGNADED